jgi:hypothetical protein
VCVPKIRFCNIVGEYHLKFSVIDGAEALNRVTMRVAIFGSGQSLQFFESAIGPVASESGSKAALIAIFLWIRAQE